MDTGNQTNNQNQDVIPQDAKHEEPKAAPKDTFTQEDVNRIVAKRVSKYSDYDELKEKAAKYDEAVEANKSELEKANDQANALQAELDGLREAEKVRALREQVSQETGVPANLLTGTTEEECNTQASAILAYAKPTYPSVPDGGEPQGAIKQSTREQFAEWMDNQT